MLGCLAVAVGFVEGGLDVCLSLASFAAISFFGSGLSAGAADVIDAGAVAEAGAGGSTTAAGAVAAGSTALGTSVRTGSGRCSVVVWGLSSCTVGGDDLRVAKYATATATMMSAAKARIACSRLCFFFAGAGGGDESARSSVVVGVASLTAGFAAGRFGRVGLACFGGEGGAAAMGGLLDTGVSAAGAGFCGAGAGRFRPARMRISLRSARDSFLLTIRRYSNRVRSGKTPVLWVGKRRLWQMSRRAS